MPRVMISHPNPLPAETAPTRVSTTQLGNRIGTAGFDGGGARGLVPVREELTSQVFQAMLRGTGIRAFAGIRSEKLAGADRFHFAGIHSWTPCDWVGVMPECRESSQRQPRI